MEHQQELNVTLNFNSSRCFNIDELRFILSSNAHIVETPLQVWNHTSDSNEPQNSTQNIRNVESDVETNETNEISEINEANNTQEISRQNSAMSVISAMSVMSVDDDETLSVNASDEISNIQTSQDNTTTTDEAMSVESSETCCICMDTPEVSCYPDGCHRSHVMCFPHCVSQYAYLSRIHNSAVRCPCCRNEFQHVRVNGSRQPIPDYAQVTRANLPVSLQSHGCERCWGIYNPMASSEDYFHTKKRGHRGRHRVMPIYYQDLAALENNNL